MFTEKVASGIASRMIMLPGAPRGTTDSVNVMSRVSITRSSVKEDREGETGSLSWDWYTVGNNGALIIRPAKSETRSGVNRMLILPE